MTESEGYWKYWNKIHVLGPLDINFVCAHSKAVVYLVYLFDKCVYPAVQTTFES